MKLQFNKIYFICFIFLLAIEVTIATFLSDGFIRFVFGDFLVVILVYCFVKSFINAKPMLVAIGVLIFSFVVEFLQLFKFTEILNLQNNHMASVILGSTFQISDLIAYTLGVAVILIIEYKIRR